MSSIHQGLLLCVLPMALTLSGCGNQNSGSSQADLLRRRQQLRESTEMSRSRTREEKIASVEANLENGDVYTANKEARELMISHPDDHELLFLYARTTADVGQKVAAAESLDAIDDSDATAHVKALWMAANWLIEEHRYEAAGERLRRMLDYPGDKTRVHRKLALSLNSQGRRREAAEHLRQLARSGASNRTELLAMITYGDMFVDRAYPKPDFTGTLTLERLAEARMLHTEGRLTRARWLIERMRKAFPDSPQIAAMQGRVYLDSQDDERLLAWTKSTPDGIEREPEYWHTLGIWLQRQQLHRQAVRCLVEAVKRDATDRNAYAALARSLQALNENELASCARERFEWIAETARLARTVVLDRAGETEYIRMAEVLGKLQRPGEAIGWLNVTPKKDGDNAKRQELLSQLRQSASTEDTLSDGFLSCSIDLSQYPLPEEDLLGSRVRSDSQQSDSTAKSPIVLRDVASDVGLEFQYDNGDADRSDNLRYVHQTTGGGIGVIDFDLDGWHDLYLAQGGGDAFKPKDSLPNQLFRNLEGQRFIRLPEQTNTQDRGYAQGVATADINQDGFADLVVANIGPNILLLNNGDGTFTQTRLPASNPKGDWTTSIACGDLSGDQLPEIVEVNYIDDPTALTRLCGGEPSFCSPRHYQPAADRVWQVNAGGDIDTWNGCRDISDKPSFGFAALISNFDGKQGNELFVANDTRDNHYWIDAASTDSASRRLDESASLHGCGASLGGVPQGSMGIAHGDLDRNGLIDLVVTNFLDQPADVFLQQSGGFFVLGNHSFGLNRSTAEPVAWGAQAVDFNRDGWLDLAILNGALKKEPPRAFETKPQLFRGTSSGFVIGKPSGAPDDYWSKPTLGRTMAVLDWNRDGHADLVANHLDVPVALLENQTENLGNSLQIELVGTRSERDAIGASVSLSAGSQHWTAWVTGGDGFLCSNEACLDFGLGKLQSIDRIEIRWPSGTTQTLPRVNSNRRLLVVEGDDHVFVRP